MAVLAVLYLDILSLEAYYNRSVVVPQRIKLSKYNYFNCFYLFITGYILKITQI